MALASAPPAFMPPSTAAGTAVGACRVSPVSVTTRRRRPGSAAGATSTPRMTGNPVAAALLTALLLVAPPPPPPPASAADTLSTQTLKPPVSVPAPDRPVWAPPPDGEGSWGLRKGSLQQCVGDANCLSSTSVRNPSKFAPPWTWASATGDEATAWASLKAQLAKLEEAGGAPAVRVIAIDDEKRYIRSEWAGFPKGVTDVVEFKFVQGDNIVTFRSCSAETRYIYPFQQPLGDLGANLDHLTRVRTALDWTELSGYTIF